MRFHHGTLSIPEIAPVRPRPAAQRSAGAGHRPNFSARSAHCRLHPAAILAILLAITLNAATAWGQQLLRHVSGRFGGKLVVAVGAEPRTFNPIEASDNSSRLLLSLTMADLMHINALTQTVEPALATSVDHLDHGRRWIIHLRHGVRFSDGVPLTSADVVFSFDVYTDPRVGSPQRDLLLIHGQPVRAHALDRWTVELDLPGPYAVGDRLFDSLWILPRHKLYAAWKAGHLDQSWGIATPPADLALLGPFVPEHWEPGRGILLKRNPWYWQSSASGKRLPLLDSLELLTVPDRNLQLTLLMRHQIDGLSDLPARAAGLLRQQRCCRVLNGGPSLNPVVLAFNLTPNVKDPALARRIGWFQKRRFRQAVSLAIDRRNLVRNVYAGMAQPLASITSPADHSWADSAPAPTVDLARARRDLIAAGFHFRGNLLTDSSGHSVHFSLIVPASSSARVHIANFLQDDLRHLGIAVQVVPLDFSSYVDHMLNRRDFDATLISFGFPDTDPNVESSLWRLNGGLHLWDLHPSHPAPWEARLDLLFRRQMVTLNPARRHALYRQMQGIERQWLPLIPLVAPDVLIAVVPGMAGVEPALLDPHLLWNAQVLSWSSGH